MTQATSTTRYRAKVLCCSAAPCGQEILTFAVQMPRVVLAEWNTHRAISRNAGSNRAQPDAVTLAAVKERPYFPDDLPDGPLCGNRPGMQATDPLPDDQKWAGQTIYRAAAGVMVGYAKMMSEVGYHKQDFNRLLEPFQWTRVVATSTQWDNFFALRCHPAAYPPFRFLARCMYAAYLGRAAVRRELREGEWHLPFIRPQDVALAKEKAYGYSLSGAEPPAGFRAWDEALLARWSAARCTRVSYNHFGQKAGAEPDPDKDLETYFKLVSGVPRHASPLEHQAFVNYQHEAVYGRSNFDRPWVQHRKLIPQETIRKYQPDAAEVESWNVPAEALSGEPGTDW